MNTKTRQQILDSVGKLLDAADVVVRIQRDLTREQTNDKTPSNNFVIGKKVTIIIAGTEK